MRGGLGPGGGVPAEPAAVAHAQPAARAAPLRDQLPLPSVRAGGIYTERAAREGGWVRRKFCQNLQIFLSMEIDSAMILIRSQIRRINKLFSSLGQGHHRKE